MTGTAILKGKKLVVIENGLFSTYTMRESLMIKLINEGAEVYVLTQTNKYVAQVEKMGLCVINVGSGNLNPVKVIKYILELRRAIKKIKPDLCLTFSIRPAIWGNLIARRMKIPTITNITGVGPLFVSRNIVYRVARALYRNALQKSKKVFFQNYDDMKLFIEKKFVKEELAERIPGSGVDYLKFSPILSSSENSNLFIFLFIGRLIKDKGIYEYVKAAREVRKQFPNVIFNVMGPFWTQNLKKNTITRKELQDWIDEGVIDYLGEKKDVRKYLAEADCVVLPSYREGTSNTLLEAASMEKPIITTNTIGCKEIVVDNVTGFLCNVKDAEDLAEKMKKMILIDKSARELMGKAGRQKIVKEFDKKIVIDAYFKAIKQALTL
jgi:glycosyltransferase involved in cell wall biosynthesis